jgi:hypothetical protein
MIEQLTICLFLFEVFFVELKKDRQTDSPKPSCDTKCLSRSSNECTTTPAEAGSSLGVPARKRALSALTRSLSELHVINFIRTSHTRIVVCIFVGHVQEGATRRRVLMRKVHTWLQQSGELRYITHDTEHNYRCKQLKTRSLHEPTKREIPATARTALTCRGKTLARFSPSLCACVHAGV